MDIYLDLSFISNIVVHSLSLLYIFFMFEFKNKILKNILIVFLLSVIVLTLPFFVIDNPYVYIIYDILILYALLPKKNKIYMILSYISIYYILIGLAQLFNSGVIVKVQMIVINKPVSTLSVILLFIPIIIIYIFSFILKKKILLHHYKYNIHLIINNNIYKIKGYFDTGNTLLIDGKPVIFVKENILINEKLNDGYPIKYNTVNNKIREDIGYEGEIIIKNKYIKILFSVVSNNYYFNNCDCLLNAFCK